MHRFRHQQGPIPACISACTLRATQAGHAQATHIIPSYLQAPSTCPTRPHASITASFPHPKDTPARQGHPVSLLVAAASARGQSHPSIYGIPYTLTHHQTLMLYARSIWTPRFKQVPRASNKHAQAGQCNPGSALHAPALCNHVIMTQCAASGVHTQQGTTPRMLPKRAGTTHPPHHTS